MRLVNGTYLGGYILEAVPTRHQGHTFTSDADKNRQMTTATHPNLPYGLPFTVR